MSEGPAGELDKAVAFVAGASRSAGWCHVLPDLPSVDVAVVAGRGGTVSRKVRGSKMPTWERVYDEFAAAWQFGDYFGENDAAFDECMRELNWLLPTESGYAVVVLQPERVLQDEADDDLGRPFQHLVDLVEIFEMCAQWYAEPVNSNDAWRRSALSFDVYLVPDAEHRDRVAYLWKQAGAPL